MTEMPQIYSEKIYLLCEACILPIPSTISEITRNNYLTCLSCHCLIAIDTEEFFRRRRLLTRYLEFIEGGKLSFN